MSTESEAGAQSMACSEVVVTRTVQYFHCSSNMAMVNGVTSLVTSQVPPMRRARQGDTNSTEEEAPAPTQSHRHISD